MPIYALKAEGMPQLARAIQAMLGLNALENNAGEKEKEKENRAATRTSGDTRNDVLSSYSNPSPKPPSTLSLKPSGVVPGGVGGFVTPAEETDALEEVRMAVEQLVIPHQEGT
jgi:hypothetical protein